VDLSTGTSITVATASATSSEPVFAPLAGPAAPNFWVSEGPSPGINGQENVPPNNQINGAIQAIAVHPTDPTVMYVGSVNGGIWKTTNATAASPHWVPLTDSLPSLSIGALQFDPTDSTHQTLIAGIGSTSSYFLNDQFTGVLRSTDGGATWSQLGTAVTDLAGENITSVAARGSTLLAGADNAWGGGLGKGLFRSTDSGAHWTLISDGAHGLPNSTPVSDIVGDPLSSNVLYAAVTGASGGVFKSTDTGLTWTNITSGIGIINSATVKIKLSVHHDATNLEVYAIVDNFSAALQDDTLSGVFRSVNGGNFTALDVPSGGTQGDVHGAVAADPTNPNIVYVGFGGGSSNYLTRIDASKPSGSQITDISGGTFGSPHVDVRNMQIDANGNLILGTDGGLFRLPTPSANTGAWSAIVGDMSVFEFHDVAYDHISHVIMAGAQDNGTLVQQTPGSATWVHPGFGDGGDVVIDNVSLAASGESIRYFSSQDLGGWTRQVYNSSNQLVSSTSLASITDGTFTTPVALNNVDPTRLLVGGSGHIYESKNQGTSLTTLANLGVNGIGFDGGNPIVYGGFQNGTGEPDLIYADSGSNVLRQTTAGGGFTSTSPGGSEIRGVMDNPANWADVFAIDNNQVFDSTNAGATWADVTTNLTSISAADFRSIDYVHGKLDDALIVGTTSGVFYTKISQLGGAASWSKLGGNLPDVIVYDLTYDSADNVLVAGTMGRGAWLVNNATVNLGIDTDTTAPFFVNDNPLSVKLGGTGTITSNLLQVSDPDNTDAQLTYTVVAAPLDGTLLKNGVATSSFTQDDIDNNRITYHETANNVTSDSFTFNVSDPAGNHTANASFQINIPRTPLDFNNDGMSDLLWRNTGGTNAVWEMNGQNIERFFNIVAVDPSYKLAGTGDFNGDGNLDLLWRNTSGVNAVWETDGNGSIQSFFNLVSVDPSYVLATVGNFNNDGTSDLLWRNSSGVNAVWEMNGKNIERFYNIVSVDPSYTLAGTGDFDGNGITDLIWRNTSGVNAVWEMNAGGAIKSFFSLPTVDPSYVLAGTGDFNDDGVTDLLWRNTTTGVNAIWEMNANGIQSFFSIPTVDTSYQVAQISDFNGDGHADILWRNTSGVNAVWEMTGNGSVNSGIQSFFNIQSVDPSYQAVGTQHNVI
jgi:Cadherin-like/FG-GAP-like repeat